jgi:hypothetical protein
MGREHLKRRAMNLKAVFKLLLKQTEREDLVSIQLLRKSNPYEHKSDEFLDQLRANQMLKADFIPL